MARLARQTPMASASRASPEKHAPPEDADRLPSRLAALTLDASGPTTGASMEETDRPLDVRQTPHRATKKKVVYAIDDDRDARRGWSEDESVDDLSDFIVSDSASEEELRQPPRSMRKEPQNTPRRLFRKKDLIGENEGSKLSGRAGVSLNDTSTSPSKGRTGSRPLQTRPINVPPWPVLEPSSDEPAESPPAKQVASPRQPSAGLRFATPPTSPSKPKLRSPTKLAAARIPASPHRPSLDAFWSQDVINAWNDEYSPTKTPRAPRTPRARRPLGSDSDEGEGGYGSPSEARRRSPEKSPTRTPGRDKAAAAAAKEAAARRKAFDARKHELAAAFLAELDGAVAGGRLAQLAASTGGVRIVWSRKLNSTAGRASWKRETIRPRAPTVPSTGAPAAAAPAAATVRHHACIELADKVIDDEARLRNVLAHEFCHLANFMLSGVTDQPHGASFRRWGAAVTAACAGRHAIRVTTRHDYAIAYRFAWACQACGARFQRHSRSLDPARHRCGACRGALLQVRPPPRKGAAAAGPTRTEAGGASRYQAFVKRWFASVKKQHADWSMGQVMAELARRYRAEKAADAEAKPEDGGDGVDRPDKGMVRAKRKSVFGNTTEEVEEVVVLDVDEGEGQVEDEVEAPGDLGVDFEALTIDGGTA